ncbi:hypothetical protein [Terrihabitans soli]|uniref:hypothetical protein n=1 Tax=Terrihabitans soli TaxID=708113 RepID=UPI001CA302B0|nr:hypothetical protein [Terrihabitans soli]
MAADTSKFTQEAERLARKAEASKSPSEKRMLETHARFYEAIAEEPDQASDPAPSSDRDSN